MPVSSLRAQFCLDKISERKASVVVTVANTRERQETIATANTYGTKFYVMGGKHTTSNDMWKAAEINRRKAEATEREKEKKSWVEYHARREAALPIVVRLEHELDNNVERLTSKKLEVLLRWKGVAALKMGKVANRQLPTNSRRRFGGGEYPGPVDQNQQSGTHRVEGCTHQIVRHGIWAVQGAKEKGCQACVPEDVGHGEGNIQEKDGGDRQGRRRRR